MARDDGEQQAMTAERLAELWTASDEPYGRHFRAMLREALAEVERQQALVEQRDALLAKSWRMNDDLRADNERMRAREAALMAEHEQAMAIVRAVADAAETHATAREYAQVSCLWFSGVMAANQTREQARALLASADSERSGGDGE